MAYLWRILWKHKWHWLIPPQFPSFLLGQRHRGQRSVLPADPGGADLPGGEAAGPALQEGQQDQGAGAVHWQPAGAHHRGATQYPDDHELTQMSVPNHSEQGFTKMFIFLNAHVLGWLNISVWIHLTPMYSIPYQALAFCFYWTGALLFITFWLLTIWLLITFWLKDFLTLWCVKTV